MKIFFENYADDLIVETELPLEGSLQQAIEIFHNLPDYDGSYIGLVNQDGYTHFVWLGNVDQVYDCYQDQEIEAINNFTKEIRLKHIIEEWEY